MSSIHDVIDMHNAKGFAEHRLSKPGFLKEDFMQMRLNFALEELKELGDACGFELDCHMHVTESTLTFKRRPYLIPDLEKAFDALIDKVYVDYGTADLMGLTGYVPRSPHSPRLVTTRWQKGWMRVHLANMAKVMVKHPTESTRGFGIDLKKPEGWTPPNLKDLCE